MSDRQLCELTFPAGGQIHYKTSQFACNAAIRTTENDQTCKVKAKARWLALRCGWLTVRSTAARSRERVCAASTPATRPLAEDVALFDWVGGPAGLFLRLCCACIAGRSIVLPVEILKAWVFSASWRFLAAVVRPRGAGKGCAALRGRL